MSKHRNPHIGSRFDDFLKEEGIYEQVTSLAIKNAGQWAAFQAALDAPPQSHPRLKRLLREPGAFD